MLVCQLQHVLFGTSDVGPLYLVLFLPAVLSDCLSDQIYDFWTKLGFIKKVVLFCCYKLKGPEKDMKG